MLKWLFCAFFVGMFVLVIERAEMVRDVFIEVNAQRDLGAAFYVIDPVQRKISTDTDRCKQVHDDLMKLYSVFNGQAIGGALDSMIVEITQQAKAANCFNDGVKIK